MYTTPGTNHRSVHPVIVDLDAGVVPRHLVEPPNPKDEEFKLWLRAVSHLVRAKFLVSLRDLPDMSTRDAFDAGCTPETFFEDQVVPLLCEEYGSEMVDAILKGS